MNTASPSSTAPLANIASPMYYVLDTNVLIDYPDIIPDSDDSELDSPNIDFRGTHIVVPTAVIRELSNHKREMNDRGYSCRTVLKRIRYIIENTNSSLIRAYRLGASVPIRGGTQFLDILPVHKDFKKLLPFAPADLDMDGQITLAAISTAMSVAGVDYLKFLSSSDDLSFARKEVEEVLNDSPKTVVLLTNDNALAIRAFSRGIHTGRFNYRLPQPYSGRRDLTVPPEMFEQFFSEGYLENADFKRFMPLEQPLIANEYIIMYPEGDQWPGGFDLETDGTVYFKNIGRYNAKLGIIESLKPLSNFPVPVRNAGQAIYADALMDRKITAVVSVGPSGCGKTYMAAIYAYDACKAGEYIGISVVPCRVQDDGVGYLPGDLNDKLDPNVQPIKNALRNYLLSTKKEFRKAFDNLQKFGATDKKPRQDDDNSDDSRNQKSLKTRLEDAADLIYDNWFGKPIPIAYARGRDFSYEIAFYDEFQDQNHTEAKNLLTRIGQGGKIIVTGDVEQVHAPYLDRDNNGLTFARNLLKDLEQVAQCTFLPSECVRSDLVRAILERLNGRFASQSENSTDPDITVEITEE